MTYYQEVTVKGSAKDYLQHLDKDALVIYSPTALSHIDIANTDIHMIDARVFGHDMTLLDMLCDNRHYAQIVGLGGGTATDIAKYIAARMQARLTCIPSVLSINSYATNQSELLLDQQRIVATTKLADKVIFDSALIAKASVQNLYGLADVFSIHTALADWRLAQHQADENLNEGIYRMASDLLASTLAFVGKTTPDRLPGSIEQIFTSIGESGHLSTIYGSSRPQSGSEHIFARHLGQRVNAPHGVAVSLGIILMSLLQQNASQPLYGSIKKLGTLDNLQSYGITRPLVKQVLDDLHPQPDRYSIINSIELTSRRNKKLIAEFESQFMALPD